MNLKALLFISAVILLSNGSSAQEISGAIGGQVFDSKTRTGIPGANVLVQGTKTGASTDPEGRFVIRNLPPGLYTLTVSVVGYMDGEISDVEVGARGLQTVEFQLTEVSVQLGEVTVVGGSLREERITDTPVAVTVLESRDVKLKSGSGQMPKLLESETGVDIVQSGLYDFNINTRGFNSSLNRRLLVLLDGRDLAIAFLSSQEWNTLSFPVEDLARLELVRGPSSSLYGANAFNGVINIHTPSPETIPGTKITLAGGEWNSARVDARHAAKSGPWGYKINVGRFQGENWHVSRKHLQFEYDDDRPGWGFSLINNEEVDLPTNRISSTYGSARVDYSLSSDSKATAEGGVTQAEGEVYVTGIGRVQVPKALKPWVRLSYSNPSWYIQMWGAGRDSKEPQLSLASGLDLIERSKIAQGEIQYRTSLFNSLYFIGGFTFRYQDVQTDQTLMLEDRTDNASGLYGQLEYNATEALRFVFSMRWDRSTLHSDEVSPKVAAVWSITPDHTVRGTFGRAFQAPNLSELYLYVLRTATSPLNPDLKSHSAFVGNSSLQVEKVIGYELGYKGVITPDLFVTVDGYLNTISDFITDLTPGVHPDYPEPAILPDDPDGFTRTVWSYTNSGKVRLGGVETSLKYYLGDYWIFDGTYSYFDFEVLEMGLSAVDLIPNAPRHKASGGVTFRTLSYEVGVAIKHIPSFDWAAGIYKGRIQSYTIVDLAGSYKINSILEIGLNITNLFDKQHYQIFGGSFIHRRALITLTAIF